MYTKPGKWMGIAGIVLLLFAFLMQPDLMYKSSPVVLILLAVTGLLLSFKYKMPGSLLLLLSGAAIAVQPLIFGASKWLIPGGLLAAIAGIIEMLKWWNQNGENEMP